MQRMELAAIVWLQRTRYRPTHNCDFDLVKGVLRVVHQSLYIAHSGYCSNFSYIFRERNAWNAI
jgi:hypothetical protein